jgi:hypothetical protein
MNNSEVQGVVMYLRMLDSYFVKID